MTPKSRLNLRLRWKQQDPSRQGAMMILGTFLVIVLCAFAAFAIDLGYIMLTQAQLQNAADAAALAAVLELKTSDSNLTPEQMKGIALAEALKAAAYNEAAKRSVVLDPNEVTFGNRHYDNNGQFVTGFDTDDGYDSSQPYNAVKVDVVYGEASGDRAKLDLWFANVIGRKQTTVGGSSRAHLTPRDLVFCLDISNSMNDDVEATSGTEFDNRMIMTRQWLDLPDAMTNAQIAPSTLLNLTRPLGTGNQHDVLNLNFTTSNVSAIVKNPVVGSNLLRLTFTAAHNLADGDQVVISNVSTATNKFGLGVPGESINGTWYITVVSTTQILLTGSNYVSPRAFVDSDAITVFAPGIFQNQSGGIRVRTRLPHGLLTGNLVSISGVSGTGALPGLLNRVNTITRVANYNTNESSRFDIVGATFTDTYTTGTTPRWIIPDVADTTTGYALNAVQRNEIYKRYWLRFIDHNGTTVGAGAANGTNMLYNAATLMNVAALEFPSGVTDLTYTVNSDFPFYQSYATTNTAATPVTGVSTGPAIAYPNGHPWMHWKWRAYVDARFTATASNAHYTYDKNVVATGQVSVSRTVSVDNFARWALANGCVPALRGQGFFGRDNNRDNVVDAFPPPVSYLAPSSQGDDGYSDYPDFAGYFPRPAYQQYRDVAGAEHEYNSAVIDFTEGSDLTGLHPDNVPDLPFSFVRQATLNGINAMISDENAGNDAFDQVALITFGTRPYVESDLTNDLPIALKLANNRLCVATSNLSVTPYGNGNTNIGGAIRRAIDVLMNENGYTRGRTYTNKTIALLTDGVPNIRAAGGNESPEMNGGNDSLSSSGGETYGQYWADRCSDNKIVLHTIGFGTGSDPTYLQDLATRTGGQFFPITDPANQVDDLNNIFIAIGKDKLGKLFSN